MPSLSLRYAAKRAVRIMPWGGSMLDETGFYAPSVAHNALPSRPWLGISAYLNIILQYLNSFAIRSLRSVRALWQGGGSCFSSRVLAKPRKFTNIIEIKAFHVII